MYVKIKRLKLSSAHSKAAISTVDGSDLVIACTTCPIVHTLHLVVYFVKSWFWISSFSLSYVDNQLIKTKTPFPTHY